MWIDEYKELMFGIENNDGKTAKAIMLKNENMPEILYKYRSVTEQTLEALENDVLYFSAVSLFNDPYECAMSLQIGYLRKVAYNRIISQLMPYLEPGFNLSENDLLSIETLKRKLVISSRISKEKENGLEVLLKQTDDYIKEFSKNASKDMKQGENEIYRVCSFSEINDSLLMWAHYANYHKGICLGYNFKELDNDLKELIFPVIYSDELLEISRYIFPEPKKSLAMNPITRKSKEWKYEKEWRMLRKTKNGEKKQSEQLPKPESVFLGTRISDKDKMKVIEIASKKNISIYQMYMETERFKLNYNKI